MTYDVCEVLIELHCTGEHVKDSVFTKLNFNSLATMRDGVAISLIRAIEFKRHH